VPEAKVTFLNLPSAFEKCSETKSLTFLLYLICHLPGRFGKDRLRYRKQKKEKNKYKNKTMKIDIT